MEKLERVDLVHGVKFVLGRRELGASRIFLLAPLAVCALIFLIFLGVFLHNVLGAGDTTMPWISWVGFLLLPLAAVVGAAWLGLNALFGHTEVELGQGYLTRVARAGPIQLRKRVRLSEIERIELGLNLTQPSHRAGLRPRRNQSDLPVSWLPGMLEDASALNVHRTRGRTVTIGFGYRKPELRELAEAIREYVQIETGAADGTIEITEAADPYAERRPSEVAKPEHSRAEVIEHESGMTFRLPALGIWKGSKGMFPFGLIFTAIAGTVGGVFFYVWLFTPDGPAGWEQLFLLIPVVLLGVGVAMTVAGINMGRREAVVDVVGDALLVTRQSMFGMKQLEWRRDDIADIVVAPSGMEVNDRPVMHLEVRPHQGKPTGLFSERDEAVLDWLAAELRRRLQIHETASGPG